MQRDYDKYSEMPSLEYGRELYEGGRGGEVHDMTDGPKSCLATMSQDRKRGIYRILKKHNLHSNFESHRTAIEGFTKIAHVRHQYGRSRDRYRHHLCERPLQRSSAFGCRHRGYGSLLLGLADGDCYMPRLSQSAADNRYMHGSGIRK